MTDIELKALERILIRKGITTGKEIEQVKEEIIEENNKERNEYYRNLRW